MAALLEAGRNRLRPAWASICGAFGRLFHDQFRLRELPRTCCTATAGFAAAAVAAPAPAKPGHRQPAFARNLGRGISLIAVRESSNRCPLNWPLALTTSRSALARLSASPACLQAISGKTRTTSASFGAKFHLLPPTSGLRLAVVWQEDPSRRAGQLEVKLSNWPTIEHEICPRALRVQVLARLDPAAAQS